MPTPHSSTADHPARERLRHGTNPFSASVAALGTADAGLRTDVREFVESQFADLLVLVRRYREDRPATQIYPILGDAGTGKTHLLSVLLAELRREAEQTGAETLTVVVDRLAPGMNPADYLLWQLVNFLLDRKREGGRLLGVIAARLTARLLAESLRQLAPHQQIELIPAAGMWDRLRLRFGSPARVRKRLDAIDDLVRRCEARHPTPEQLVLACERAGLRVDRAVSLIGRHLERTESTDVLGWFRKELYGRLAHAALLGDPTPFEDFHNGTFEQGPANVRELENLNRRLLETWLELLAELSVPVVVVFDQLEDYLRSVNDVKEKENRRAFTQAVASFVNDVPGACVLVFAEEGLWNELLRDADKFTTGRLSQPFSLPGRPSQARIEMPGRVEPAVLTQLIQRRIRAGFPDLDLTGLPPAFPFDEADLKKLQRETTIRDCLRRLAKRYDDLVYGTPAPAEDVRTGLSKPPLRERLELLWKEQLAAAAKKYGTDLKFSPAFIPEVQNALGGWLRSLFQEGLSGEPPWAGVDLLNDPAKQQYGYLNVVRTDGPNNPGIGIAAWLGEGAAKPHDLKQRLLFFKGNPCPIRTLVLLRKDGPETLTGATRVEYEKAVKAGRDMRVHPYEPRHLHSLMAFTPWHQTALPDVRGAGEEGTTIFRAFLADLSKEMLGWLEQWRH